MKRRAKEVWGKGRARGGQALVELVFLSGLWGMMVSGLVVFTRFGLLRERALSTARLACMLRSSGVVADETVQAEVDDHIRRFNLPAEVEWNWRMERFMGTPAARFYRLVAAEVVVHGRFLLWGNGVLPRMAFSERVVIQEVEP